MNAVKAALSAFFSTPDPRLVRRYGLAIILALGLPKIVWDIWRLRASRSGKTSGNDADSALVQKDPVLKVLRVTVAKAVVDLREAWEVCLAPYCDAAPCFDTQIKALLQDAEDMTGKDRSGEGDGEARKENGSGNNSDVEKKSSGTDKGNDRNKEKIKDKDHTAEDSFLAQWESTLAEVIVYPLSEALNAKEEDMDLEADIREMAASLIYLHIILKTLITTQRRKNAMAKYLHAKAEYEENIGALKLATMAVQVQKKGNSSSQNENASPAEAGTAEQAPTLIELRTKSQITSAAMAASVDASRVERTTKLLDEMNRARAKLEKRSERQMMSVGRDAERLEIEDFYWWVPPAQMNQALASIATAAAATSVTTSVTTSGNITHTPAPTGLTMSSVTAQPLATVSSDHACLWSSADWNERRLQYHAEGFPSKHGEHLQSLLTTCGAHSRLMSLEIDRVLGGVKKERFFKLLHFINHDLCGAWHQRALIVFAWGLGAVEAAANTAEGYYRTNLLMKSVETVVSSSTGSVKPKSASSLLTVCIGIVVLNFSRVLLDDLLGKVKNAGQGSIRAGLSRKLTHHVLSQDLDDAVESSGKKRGGRRRNESPADLIGSLQDERQWSRSLGSVLLIPQELISMGTRLLSSGMLLWNKSPQLLAAVLLAVIAKKRVLRWVKRVEKWCTKKAGLDKQTWDGWLQNYSITQALEDFEDMRVNAKELAILEEVEKTQAKAESEMINHRLMPSLFKPINTFLRDVPTIVGAYIGGRLAQSNTLSVSDLAGFTSLSTDLVRDWNRFRRQISDLWSLSDRRFEHGFAIMDLLDQQPKIGIDGGWKPPKAVATAVPVEERVDARTKIEESSRLCNSGDDHDTVSATRTDDGVASTVMTLPDVRLSGSIEFKNVFFKYKGMQSAMLKDANFRIPEGAFVGICGERGAGKTTLFKLIMRLYDVQKGEVFIGGHPVKYYNPVWLRSQIGISKQSPVIFNYKTLRENVMYGSESKVRELGGPIEADKFIERVLKKANIWDHFQNKEKFPQGLATCCYNLSGGETRSVGTARALLSVPSILLLDEPTEGLDAVNERKVMRNIVEMRPKGQTVLAIAHRLSSIKDADVIIFLGNDGTIKEMGTWDELVAIKGGNFAEFRLAQNINGPVGSNAESAQVMSTKVAAANNGAMTTEKGDTSKGSTEFSNTIAAGVDSNTATHSKGIMADLDGDQQGVDRDDDGSGEELRDGSLSGGAMVPYRHAGSSGCRSGEEDKIARAIEAIRDLRKLASAEAVPFDLVKNLTDACDKVVDYQRVAEMAARSAATWRPYHSLQSSKRLFSSPQELVSSLRKGSTGMKTSSRRRVLGRQSSGSGGNAEGSEHGWGKKSTARSSTSGSSSGSGLSPVALTRSRSSGRHGLASFRVMSAPVGKKRRHSRRDPRK